MCVLEPPPEEDLHLSYVYCRVDVQRYAAEFLKYILR